MTDYIADIMGPGGRLARAVGDDYEVRDGQIALARAVDRGIVEERTVLGDAPCGSGKCLERGTPVLRYGGQIVPVEDICTGDELMGPDSRPRRVLATASGIGPMYRIVPIKGEAWGCNNAHVLTLSRRGNKPVNRQRPRVDHKPDRIVDISVEHYLKLSATEQQRLKLFQPDIVHFSSMIATLAVSPYFLGVWLGDGHKHLEDRRGIGTDELHIVAITKPDPEIELCCRDEAARFGLTVRVSIDPRSGCPTYHLVRTGGNNHGAGISKYERQNPLLNALRELIGNEIRIPYLYRCGDVTVRAAVLAGLLDTDGYTNGGGYEITQSRKILADDIAFVARSLGLRVTQRNKIVNGKLYHRLFLSGDMTFLPMRVPRKVSQVRRQIKDVCRTGFNVIANGHDQFFGFTLDDDGRYLLGDFTVTHNSIAYLVPALHHAKRGLRVAVSTALLGLQDQIVNKDLPFLLEVLPDLAVPTALLKGRANYYCEYERVRNADQIRTFLNLADGKDERRTQAETIVDWIYDTEVGDRAELPFVPRGDVWSLFGCQRRCNESEETRERYRCLAREARAVAAAARLVIVNHHLLVCGMKYPRALPAPDGRIRPFDVLIVDEAHELPGIARSFFGYEVAERGALGLIDRVRKLLSGDKDLQDACDAVSRLLRGHFDRARALAGGRGSATLKAGMLPPGKELLDGLKLLSDYATDAILTEKQKPRPRTDDAEAKADEADAASRASQEDGESDEQVSAYELPERLDRLALRLIDVGECADTGAVYCADVGDRPVKLVSKVIDVGAQLGPMLRAVRSAVLVSATLAVPPTEGLPTPFSFIRSELGLDGAPEPIEIAVPSPFDHAVQSMLVVPEEIDGTVAIPPEPGPWDRGTPEEQGQLWDAEAKVIRKVIDLCGGRTLVLCTSNKHVEGLAKRLRRGLPYRLLKHGDMQPKELIRAFSEDETSVLVATGSFWTGVDVPGDALVALVIHRLPHPHFTDPVVEVLITREVQKGASQYAAWLRHALPRSLMRVRQGAGRLIRSRRDVGVVVGLDGRLISKAYGGLVRDAIRGDEAVCTDLDAIGPYLEWGRKQVRG